MAAPGAIGTTPPLPNEWGRTALALRGYNQTNLGRTRELLAISAYAGAIEHWLQRAGEVCSDVLHRRVQLLQRVQTGREAGLADYAEAVALIMGIELAQLEVLDSVHGYPAAKASVAFGYSLGEVVATAVAGLLEPEDAMRVPLALASDCAALASDATLAIIFSRHETIADAEIALYCIDITSQGQGTIGVSSVLSPNSLLVVGQANTVEMLEAVLKSAGRKRLYVRRNPDRWPPLHTPIVRQANVPDRAAVMMASMATPHRSPSPSIFSLTSGRADLGPLTLRETMRNWADHPQRLWDAVRYTLEADVRTVVHVGPEPNVIPATFTRLAENVAQQSTGHTLRGYGMWAISGMARQRWLASVLPRDSVLLRAPQIRQIVLEDWLIAHAPQ